MFSVMLLAILSNSWLPFSEPVEVRVSLIELNHKYDDRGKHTFTQAIFWERQPCNGQYRVRDWVIVDCRESLSGIPVQRNGVYESAFVKNNVFFRVRSPLCRESWTHVDPEIEDSKSHPSHVRNPLKSPPKVIEE